MNLYLLNRTLSFSVLSLIVANLSSPAVRAQVAQAQVAVVPPATLVLDFMGDSGKPHTSQHGVLIMSNKEHIYVTVTLRFRPGTPMMTASDTDAYQYPQFESYPDRDAFQKAATLSLRVQRRTGKGWTAIPVSVHSTGAGADLSEGGNAPKMYENVWFTLPRPLMERRERAARFWNALQRQASPYRQVLTAQEKQSVIDYLVEETVDNQPGAYNLQAVYTAHEPGFWNGSVRSLPVSLNIVDRGNPYLALSAQSAVKQQPSPKSSTQKPKN